jgi:hypothetical protein
MGHLLPHATQQTAWLFDHLVGAHEKRLWDRPAESFGGRKIDDEVEFSRLLDRKVFRLGAAEDLDNQTRCLPIDRYKTRAVCDQTTLFRHFWPFINRGQAQSCGPLDNDTAIEGEQRRRQHVQCTGPPMPWPYPSQARFVRALQL